jgi:hypothetical protein
VTYRKSKSRKGRSSSRKHLKSSQAPYDALKTLELIKDIAQNSLEFGTDTTQLNSLLVGCLQNYVDNTQKYDTVLSTFWSKMEQIYQKSKWDQTVFQDLLKPIQTKSVLIGQNNQKYSCSALKVKQAPDMDSLKLTLGQSTYFGGFTGKTTYSQKFIDGMISSHRDNLKVDTFTNINKISRT